MKYKLSKKVVSAQLKKVKGLLEKAGKQAKQGDNDVSQLGAGQQTLPQPTTFISSGFKIPVEKLASESNTEISVSHCHLQITHQVVQHFILHQAQRRTRSD